MQVQGDVVLSAEDAAKTIQQLNARAESLMRLVEAERRRGEESIVNAVPDVLRLLRLHGVVLLNFNVEPASDLRDRISDPAAVKALGEAWNLSHAPLPQSVIDAVRETAKGGSHRW